MIQRQEENPLAVILREVSANWPAIRWTFRIDNVSDGYMLRGRKDGMWAMRLIPGTWDIAGLLCNKVFVAAGDIEAHLKLFDATTKRLRWHAPRRAR